MSKKVKKQVKIKILPIVLIIISLIIVIGGYLLLSLVPIKNIYIKGNNYLTDQEIIELADIEDYPSIIKTSKKTIKRKLKKNQYIKNVSVKKKLFAEIHITIEEEKLLFRKEENQLVVLESKKEIDDNNQYQLPVLVNYIPDTKYNNFIKGMAKINEDIKDKISEVRYYPNEQDEDRFLLYMNDGNYVYLTLTKFKQINYYEDVLEKLEGKKGILYLDSGNHFKIMEE